MLIDTPTSELKVVIHNLGKVVRFTKWGFPFYGLLIHFPLVCAAGGGTHEECLKEDRTCSWRWRWQWRHGACGQGCRAVALMCRTPMIQRESRVAEERVAVFCQKETHAFCDWNLFYLSQIWKVTLLSKHDATFLDMVCMSRGRGTTQNRQKCFPQSSPYFQGL